jgi:23S rRNA G2445 N2-methylase RlmL
MDNNMEGLESNFPKNINSDSWNALTKEASTFVVETIKLAEADLPSPDISASFGAVIKDYVESKNKELNVKLKNPDLSCLVFIGDNFCGVGIDVISFDLSKRPYKLFHHPSSLNGVFAYSISRYAGVKKDSIVLDPFCGNGVIPIEIALFQQGMSSFLFERKFSGLKYSFTKESFEKVEKKLKELKPASKQITAFDEQLKIMLGAKKNAKIAGVLEALECSKVSVDWLDTKFEKEEVDIIITNPPKESKRLGNLTKIVKIYDELYYQARHILKKKGIIALLVHKPEPVVEIAKKHQFEHLETKEAHSGKQANYLVICRKKS